MELGTSSSRKRRSVVRSSDLGKQDLRLRCHGFSLAEVIVGFALFGLGALWVARGGMIKMAGDGMLKKRGELMDLNRYIESSFNCDNTTAVAVDCSTNPNVVIQARDHGNRILLASTTTPTVIGNFKVRMRCTSTDLEYMPEYQPKVGNDPWKSVSNDIPIVCPGKFISAIDAGDSFSCAIQKGAAKCWGAGDGGYIGDGFYQTRYVPTQVQGMTAGVTKISAGETSSCAIQNGALLCWGSNQYGLLGGYPTIVRSPTPLQAQGLASDVTDISVGGDNLAGFACAVQGGNVYCWGVNTYGQLGNGTTTPNTVPTQVPGLTGVTQITTGYGSVCVIQVGGAAKCWGRNTYGQLGNGQTTNSFVPVQVTGLDSGVTQISNIGETTCAVHNNKAKCWGRNTYGQLGNGSTINESLPTQVPGLDSGVTAVSTELMNTCAIQNGAAKCWGYNNFGQLGNNSLVNSLSPVQVLGLESGVSAISVGGYYFTCAIQNAIGKCWGNSNVGVLGFKNPPVRQLVPANIQF